MLGALPDEVGIMNSLTVNEHLQLVGHKFTYIRCLYQTN